VLVRIDIPLADQIVQVGHACLEAGHRFEQPQEPCHLVLLSVDSEKELQIVVERAELSDARCVVFYEPDNNLGWTAACTEPVTGINRRVFQRLPLWRADAANQNERDPPVAFYPQRIKL
jgi:hypothetical protein